MDKLENLDNLQFLVTELVGSIRQNIIEEPAAKNGVNRVRKKQKRGVKRTEKRELRGEDN